MHIDFFVLGDYHLFGNSPCIDMGISDYLPSPDETDLDGNPRVIGGRIDMGAYEHEYEYQPPVQAEMRMTPTSLNCKSRGRWVKAHLVLPEGILAEDIGVSRPAIAEPIGVESEYVIVVGAASKLVRVEIGFEREAVCSSPTQNGEIEILVRGSLTDGRYFDAKQPSHVNYS